MDLEADEQPTAQAEDKGNAEESVPGEEGEEAEADPYLGAEVEQEGSEDGEAEGGEGVTPTEPFLARAPAVPDAETYEVARPHRRRGKAPQDGAEATGAIPTSLAGAGPAWSAGKSPARASLAGGVATEGPRNWRAPVYACEKEGSPGPKAGSAHGESSSWKAAPSSTRVRLCTAAAAHISESLKLTAQVLDAACQVMARREGRKNKGGKRAVTRERSCRASERGPRLGPALFRSHLRSFFPAISA